MLYLYDEKNIWLWSWTPIIVQSAPSDRTQKKVMCQASFRQEQVKRALYISTWRI